MPYKSVLHEDKLIGAIATMRDALQDDHRKAQNGICEMLELAESGIAYNLRESLQRQIATVSSANEITGAKIDTLVVVARLIAQFTKYEYVKDEGPEEATGD
jgi:hypothetical protein